mgnify:CR=1 FL=1
MESFASDNVKIRRGRRRANPNDRGYAIILALVVLAALIAIATPFLLATRGSARSSAVRSGMSARGSRPTRPPARSSGGSKPPIPRTTRPPAMTPMPRCGRSSTFPRISIRPAIPRGRRVRRGGAGAGPDQYQLCLGRRAGASLPHSHLVETLQKDGNEVAIESADGFPDDGVVWIDGELIRYRGKSGGRLTNLSAESWARAPAPTSRRGACGRRPRRRRARPLDREAPDPCAQRRIPQIRDGRRDHARQDRAGGERGDHPRGSVESLEQDDCLQRAQRPRGLVGPDAHHELHLRRRREARFRLRERAILGSRHHRQG